MRQLKPGFFLFLILSGITFHSFAQKDLSFHFKRNIYQASYTNPAFTMTSKYFVGLPLISYSSLNFGHKGFVYSDLLVKKPGTDSLHFDVENALSKMKDRGFLSYESSSDLFSGAIAVNTFCFGINISEKSSYRISYSKDLLKFIWYGNRSLVGELPDYSGYAAATRYEEIGFNIAEKKRDFSYGVRMKLLSGIYNVKTDRDTFLFLYTDTAAYENTGNSNFTIRTSGLDNSFSASSGRGFFNTKNIGYGLDAGINYFLSNEKVSLSASIVDFGFIQWKNNIVNYSSKTALTFKGTNLDSLAAQDSITLNGTTDSLQNFFLIDRTSDHYNSSLVPKIYLSARYQTSPKVTWGFVFYSEVIHKKYYPNFSLFYGKKVSSYLDFNLSYAVINKTFGNVGGGVTIQRGPLQVYFLTENIISAIRAPLRKLVVQENSTYLYLPPSSEIYSIRFGFNLLLGYTQTSSRPSIPY